MSQERSHENSTCAWLFLNYCCCRWNCHWTIEVFVVKVNLKRLRQYEKAMRRHWLTTKILTGLYHKTQRSNLVSIIFGGKGTEVSCLRIIQFILGSSLPTHHTSLDDPSWDEDNSGPPCGLARFTSGSIPLICSTFQGYFGLKVYQRHEHWTCCRVSVGGMKILTTPHQAHFIKVDHYDDISEKLLWVLHQCGIAGGRDLAGRVWRKSGKWPEKVNERGAQDMLILLDCVNTCSYSRTKSS